MLRAIQKGLNAAMLTSVFKTTPYKHQVTAYEFSKDAEVFALLMEQGTGKSKVIIDTTAYNYGRGRVEALFVTAPNGVHINWIVNEVTAHLHDAIPRRCAFWSANMTKRKRAEIESLYDPTFKGLRVFTMNVDAFTTEKGRKEAARFLKTFKSLWCVDESSRIKSHKAKRTSAIVDMGDLAILRRIATGTPVTQSPLDIFPQFRFLDPWILKTQNFQVFKATYAVLLEEGHGLLRHIKERVARQLAATGSKRRQFTPQIVAKDKDGKPRYKDLDKLQALIAPYSYRVRKDECLDLPKKIYQRAYCEMTPAQLKMYQDLKTTLRLQLASGELTTVTKLTLILRLQQIVCGYGPNETGMQYDVPLFKKPADNPRIQACLDAVEETDGGTIIWCRFRQGILDIASALRETFPEDGVALYYGDVKQPDRVQAVEDFQKGRKRFFVGQQQSGGIGLTLTAARTMVYYANDFSLETRLQSEDRAHRIGQRYPVSYIDIEALDSMDARIVQALRDKKDVANLITGDPICDWI